MSEAAKRRFDRFVARECRVEVFKGGMFGLGKKEDIGGAIVDMSDSGLRFVCREKPALGAVLKLKLKFPPIQAEMDLKGVVRWCTQEDGKNVIGVEFDRISDGELAQIKKLRDEMNRLPGP